MSRQPKQQILKHVTGGERACLERLIEAQRKKDELVSASELMQVTKFLRRLCPPMSRIHDRAWNNGDLFPGEAA